MYEAAHTGTVDCWIKSYDEYIYNLTNVTPTALDTVLIEGNWSGAPTNYTIAQQNIISGNSSWLGDFFLDHNGANQGTPHYLSFDNDWSTFSGDQANGGDSCDWLGDTVPVQLINYSIPRSFPNGSIYWKVKAVGKNYDASPAIKCWNSSGWQVLGVPDLSGTNTSYAIPNSCLLNLDSSHYLFKASLNVVGTNSPFCYVALYDTEIISNATYSYSSVLPAGTFYWKSYASDSAGGQNATDTWYFTINSIPPDGPHWSGNQIFIPAAYDPSINSVFSIIWAANQMLDTIIIEGNWDGVPVNYTFDTKTTTNITVNASYNATVASNADWNASAGKNYDGQPPYPGNVVTGSTVYNRTVGYVNYTFVTDNKSSIKWHYNLTWKITDSGNTNLFVDCLGAGGGHLLDSYYLNGLNSLSVGTYSFSGTTPATGASTTIANCYNTTGENKIMLAYQSGGWPTQCDSGGIRNCTTTGWDEYITYTSASTVLVPAWTVNNITVNYSDVLSAGTFYWKSYADTSGGIWNATDAFTFSIGKAANPADLYLSDSGGEHENQDMTAVYGTQTNATAVAAVGTPMLYRDGVYKGMQETATLGAGTYAYVANSSGNANYSGNSTTDYLTVSKADAALNLSLNGAYGSVTVASGTTVNVSATSANTESNITIWNGTSVLAYGQSPLAISAAFNIDSNITAEQASSGNYSAAAPLTLWITMIVDQTPTPPCQDCSGGGGGGAAAPANATKKANSTNTISNATNGTANAVDQTPAPTITPGPQGSPSAKNNTVPPSNAPNGPSGLFSFNVPSFSLPAMTEDTTMLAFLALVALILFGAFAIMMKKGDMLSEDDYL